tara:strand:- start:1204 stop:1470 length:267 start_codon:yes stop_codon:yes gene_type:complete
MKTKENLRLELEKDQWMLVLKTLDTAHAALMDNIKHNPKSAFSKATEPMAQELSGIIAELGLQALHGVKELKKQAEKRRDDNVLQFKR